MNTLDKLAASAIILQFVAVLYFGFALTRNQAVQEEQILAVESQVNSKQVATPIVVSVSPTPSISVTSGVSRGSSASGVIGPVRPIK